MQELINRIVERLGLDAGVAEKAIGIVLDFLKTEAPSEKIEPLLNALPGAQELLGKLSGELSSSNSDDGGLLSGALGGLVGGNNGIMGALSKLQAEGIDMTQARTLGQEIFNFAQENVGEDMINEVKESIPGLSQIL